ncbi:MAG: FtsX-like permease family protein [Verrucomicrobia bacterium]|nr:FtsX-like permease family protein [Verrucomicrobiota bacterium]
MMRRRADWVESMRMAFEAVRAHKLRSGLTLLGVMIGVFSIILVMTTLRAMQRSVEGELSGLGANTFQVARWPGIMLSGPSAWERYRRRTPISMEHFRLVERKATLALGVGAEESISAGEAVSRFGNTPPNVEMTGVTPGVFPARNWSVKDGRAIADADVDSEAYVCVLGASLEKTLFPFGSALGEKVKLDGVPYRVVGLLEPRGAIMGGDQDNFAVIPITTGLSRYGRIWRSIEILVQAPDVRKFEDSMEQVRGILRVARRVAPGAEDDFEIFSNDSLIGQFLAFTLTARIAAAVVSSIALLAAGIGIMNIMLVSVTERTCEIGIRRAIGAKRSNILTQFLTEAVVLCQLGGIAGVVLGLAAGNIAARVLNLPLVVPVDWVIAALVICSVVGIVFGVYPARKAAGLDPIESLRYE